MVKISFVLACAVTSLIAGSASAQERLSRLTLDEAIQVATRANATLRTKELEVRSTQANEITAALRPNPTASYAVEQLPGGGDALVQHNVAVGQPIETGGKRQRRIESAQAATRVSTLELSDVRRQVVFQVKKAFNDVLVAQETLALAEQNLRTLGELERLQRIRAEKGDISELELTRIQIQQFAFERDAADASQAVQAAKIALRTAAGPDVIAPDFEIVGQLAFRDLALAREELYRLALANRPDLRAAEAAREKAQADLRLARANASWDFTPQIEYQRIGSADTFGLGVSIPLRVFDRNQGEIARTRAEIDRTGAQRQVVATQILADLDTALSAVTAQRAKLTLLRDTYLPKAQRARDTVDFAYRRGGLSLLDLLDAQRVYRETSLEYLRSLGNYWTAVYQLESAVGGSLGK
jgi:cobalt-zinc-cadmium efflux system outer membrane protein